MVEVDLTTAGLQATMQAPEGATVERKPLGVVVTAEQFEVAVWERSRDLDEARRPPETKNATRCSSTSPTRCCCSTSRWAARTSSQPSTWDVNGQPWSCATDPLGKVDDESAGHRMIEACRSLRAK